MKVFIFAVLIILISSTSASNDAAEPCVCAADWTQPGYCDTTQHGCPAVACDDPDEPRWCKIENIGCATDDGGYTECGDATPVHGANADTDSDTDSPECALYATEYNCVYNDCDWDHGVCTDKDNAAEADETAVAGAYSDYGYQLISFGKCEDSIYLDDKAFPDLLFPSHALYDKDGIKECLNRCMSNHNSNNNIGTQAFYVKNVDDKASGSKYYQCACSKGTCTSQDIKDGTLYTAYSIKKLPPKCASIEGDDSSVCVGKGAFYDPKKKEVRCTSDPCSSADEENCCTVFAGRYQGWNAPDIDCPGHKKPALTLWMPSGVKMGDCAALIPSYYFKVTCVNGVHKFAGYPTADCTGSALLNIPSDTCHADSNGGSEHWTLGSGFGDCGDEQESKVGYGYDMVSYANANNPGVDMSYLVNYQSNANNYASAGAVAYQEDDYGDEIDFEDYGDSFEPPLDTQNVLVHVKQAQFIFQLFAFFGLSATIYLCVNRAFRNKNELGVTTSMEDYSEI